MKSNLKTAIRTALKLAASGDPIECEAAIGLALHLKMSDEARRHLIKAQEEISLGVPATAETLLQMALDELDTVKNKTKRVPVDFKAVSNGPWSYEPGGVYASGFTVAQVDPGGRLPVKQVDALGRMLASLPQLRLAAKCALADLEGLMPDVDASGQRQHAGWITVKQLKAALKGVK